MSAALTSIAVALVFWTTVSARSPLYNKIQSLVTSCSTSDSCSPVLRPSNDHMWGDRICECDLHCVRFRTCCADSAYIDIKFPFPLPEPEQERCQKLENFPERVMMVSKCASGWTWPSDVKRKCEEGEHSANDHLWTSVPLTKTGTLTTFRNYFCALCNYGGNDFLYWNVVLEEKETPEVRKMLQKKMEKYVSSHVVYGTDRRSWMIPDEQNTESYEVNMRYVLPTYMYKMVKKCNENLIQTCDPSNARTKLEWYCHFYYSPVEIKTEKGIPASYRNIHCALCNGKNASSIVKKICTKKRSKRAQRKPISFALLLDINQTDGDRVGLTRVPVPDCGKDRIFDPYAKICRDLICAPIPGIVLKDGKCVRE